MKNTFHAFLRGICYGMGCGVLGAIGLLLLLSIAIGGLNGGLINAYTLYFCVICAFFGSVVGAILGPIFSAVGNTIDKANPQHPSVTKNKTTDEPPLSSP